MNRVIHTVQVKPALAHAYYACAPQVCWNEATALMSFGALVSTFTKTIVAGFLATACMALCSISRTTMT